MATIWARRRPIRDGAVRSNARTCRIFNFPLAPGGTAVPSTGHTRQDGRPGLASRYVWENSNARFVGAVVRSGFIAVICPATGKFFSANSRLGGYFGVKPKVRSNRLA
jgi:hypothetical protein